MGRKEKMKKKKYNGIVLWSGKSLYDGERIMMVATGVFSQSENRKTGDVIQTYILRRDIPPILARRLGEDKSQCGRCRLRENSVCYVNLGRSISAVFRAFHDGRYKDFEEEDIKYFKDRVIRLGTYGDPAFVDFSIIEKIAKVAKRVVGYTHAFSFCDQRLKKYCMASVDSIKGYMAEYEKAKRLGWRTFRIRESLENELVENEIMCPASEEAGKLTTCDHCGMCGGLNSVVKKDISIVLHADSEEMGARWRYDRYVEMMKKVKNKKKY